MEPDRHVHHVLLAYLRHELCTPINGMMGYSELLLEALRLAKDLSL
jgi:signal transduction histidine kinase